MSVADDSSKLLVRGPTPSNAGLFQECDADLGAETPSQSVVIQFFVLCCESGCCRRSQAAWSQGPTADLYLYMCETL